MGGLAMDLQAQGWTVTGMDAHALPPMCDLLRSRGILFDSGPGPFTVPVGADVVVTSSIPSGDSAGLPQARLAGVPVLHLPAFLKAHCLGQSRRLVVSGTNGKTTTSAMLTWILQQAGLEPDFLIGGRCDQLPGMVRMRQAPLAVIEGDEYVACEEEGIAKFHFYDPEILLLTNVDHDHAEVYADQHAVETEFASLIAKLPQHGLLIAAEGTAVDRLAAAASCRVLRVGWGSDCDLRLTEPRQVRGKMQFNLQGRSVSLSMYGRMNALNAALAVAAAMECGVQFEQAAAALGDFQGVADRCEILLDRRDLTVIADNGYHPVALRESLAAMRMRFPGRRLVVAFQPRYTGGRGGFLHRGLPDALALADQVILTPLYDYGKFPGGPLTNRILAADLRKRGLAVEVISKAQLLPATYRRLHDRGDVLFCSLAMFQEEILTKLAHLPPQQLSA